jgi:hypothetical protein
VSPGVEVAVTVGPIVLIMVLLSVRYVLNSPKHGGELALGVLAGIFDSAAPGAEGPAVAVFDLHTAQGTRFRGETAITLRGIPSNHLGAVIPVWFRPDRQDGRVDIAFDVDPARVQALKATLGFPA